MSFLYPRTVSVARPVQAAGVGAAAYGGQIAGTETPVVSGLPASIQIDRQGMRNAVGLPGDSGLTRWLVFVPLDALALGVVRERDIVTDDLGNRYQVTAAYWNSLGHQLGAEKLQA